MTSPKMQFLIYGLTQNPSNYREHDGRCKDKKKVILQILAEAWEVGVACISVWTKVFHSIYRWSVSSRLDTNGKKILGDF